MPSEKDKIVEFKHYMKFDKMPYIIYGDIESLIKKIGGCENNPEKSSTTKRDKHIPCGYSMSTIWGFNHIEDKYTLYRRRRFMKKFYESLREHAKSIIVFEKKKILPLTRKELKSHEDAEKCYICETKFFKKLFTDKNYQNHCHYAGKYA